MESAIFAERGNPLWTFWMAYKTSAEIREGRIIHRKGSLDVGLQITMGYISLLP